MNEPDLIVRSADGLRTLFVVEVKLVDTSQAMTSAEMQLRATMFGVRCPLGLLVTPKRLRFYGDSYKSYSPESIEHLAEHAAVGLFPVPTGSGQAAAFELEASVQAWLESLVSEASREKLDPGLRTSVERYLLPILREGSIRAGGPRWVRSSAPK